MTEADLQTLHAQVLWAGFLLSAVFGAIAQRSHFCTMGAVSDIVTMGDWSRMRMWIAAIGTATIGFNTMVALGWVSAANSLYGGPRVMWLSALVGGALFGIGMVLGSGCGSKTLVRMGGGNLKSLVVFIVLGLSAFATLKGITGVARVATVDRVYVELAPGQDLPSLVAAASGAGRPGVAGLLGLVIGGALLAFALAPRESRRGVGAGIAVGTIVVAVWWVSGRLGHVAEDPRTLEEAFVATNSRRMESLSFVAPIAYLLDWLLFFSDASKALTLGIVSALGVVAGAAAQALASRSFRWEGFRDTGDMARHLAGGALMGVGGVTAIGCTIGQGVSGVSTLGLTSLVALGAILAGAVAALRWQMWQLERSA